MLVDWIWWPCDGVMGSDGFIGGLYVRVRIVRMSVVVVRHGDECDFYLAKRVCLIYGSYQGR
ncbi:hypothetical protein Lalb_Chr12g0210721 [Lupinus albus]|uniref:Uncharacterized protein n=1 Tax=Lupinus albus TaxID=3870 RepID=A0A6A4PPP1_LUPAL|nr:hypothetical protein Lalb_Chr12g0210721 [Lupinus albus]